MSTCSVNHNWHVTAINALQRDQRHLRSRHTSGVPAAVRQSGDPLPPLRTAVVSERISKRCWQLTVSSGASLGRGSWWAQVAALRNCPLGTRCSQASTLMRPRKTTLIIITASRRPSEAKPMIQRR